MKRKEFIEKMDVAFKRVRSRWCWYSCSALSLDPFNRIRMDYCKMFNLNKDTRDYGAWLDHYNLDHDEIMEERLAMLELFKQLVLDGKGYVRY